MTLLDRLERWKTRGKITPDQYLELSALVRHDRFSVFVELNALLYLGVLSFVGGLGWTINTYFAQFGDTAIILSLLFLFGGCLVYCQRTARPWTPSEAESPNFVFDYVLYLGCLAFSLLVSYSETRFHLLDTRWDVYLLIASGLFMALAYRFDNRFVLSLGLSSLAAWFGVRQSRLHLAQLFLARPHAISYALLVGSLGIGLHRLQVKAHFLPAYLHIAVNVLLLACVGGAVQYHSGLWPYVLLLLSTGTGYYGFASRQYVFACYGVLYGYVGLSAIVSHWFGFFSGVLLYYLISGCILIFTLVRLSRYFGTDNE
jgi:hypothetical protein